MADAWGELSILINNAGICPYTPPDDITVDEWDAVLETNARGTFLMTRAALPLLRAAAGDRSVVNISSIAGQTGGYTTSVHYAASKGAILAITRSDARRLAGEGIRVNAVTPGPIDTSITDQAPPRRSRADRTTACPDGPLWPSRGGRSRHRAAGDAGLVVHNGRDL